MTQFVIDESSIAEISGDLIIIGEAGDGDRIGVTHSPTEDSTVTFEKTNGHAQQGRNGTDEGDQCTRV